MMYCSKCGKPIASVNLDCPHCGLKAFGVVQVKCIGHFKFYQRKLVKFMWAKAVKLRCLPYCHTLIIRDLMSWTDEEAERVWVLIEGFRITGLRYLGISSCPYCLSNRRPGDLFCGLCYWGSINGKCKTDRHNFNGVYKIARKRGYLLTNQWYRDTIELISQKFKTTNPFN